MKDCECLPRCPFFNDKMANMPSVAKLIKDKYCKGDNTKCARHIVFIALGSGKVPPNLFPSQIERVEEILKNK